MTKASDNAIPSILITEGTEPTAPAAGKQRLYIDSTTKELMLTDSAGAETRAGRKFIGAFVYNSTTQSFAATTLTTITFDSEAYDTSSIHSTSSNTGRLTAPVTGYYRISGGIWYATTSGTNYVLFDKNGAASYIRGGATAQNGGGSGMFLSTTALLTATDYVTMVGYHTEAGTIATGDTGSTPSQQNWFAIELLGV